MTARRYQLNGFYWSSVNGYRGSYLTAYGNGDYGIYAFDSVWGRFEHIVRGRPAGFGLLHRPVLPLPRGDRRRDLRPQRARVQRHQRGRRPRPRQPRVDGQPRGHRAQHARLGAAGAAAGDHDRRQLDPRQQRPPTRRRSDSSARPTAWASCIGGGRDNLVTGNLVEDNPTFGIAILPNLDDNLWLTQGNAVRDNVVRRSGRADLALGAPSRRGRLLRRQRRISTSLPPAIETVRAAAARASAAAASRGPTFGLLARFAQALGGHWYPRRPGRPSRRRRRRPRCRTR